MEKTSLGGSLLFTTFLCVFFFFSKKIRALDSLIGMIQKFPYEDPTYEKLQDDLEKIRGKFKQVCRIKLLFLTQNSIAFCKYFISVCSHSKNALT